jgi:flagellar basal-body rod protein FlgC
MKINKLFLGYDINAAGLTAQRKRMNAIAENIANVETTKTASGGAYRRKVVQLKEKGTQMFSAELQKATASLTVTQPGHMEGSGVESGESVPLSTGITAVTKTDQSPLKIIYDPTNPDADENGNVAQPNVDVVTEMVDMISASRSYEANVVAMNAAKAAARDALEI